MSSFTERLSYDCVISMFTAGPCEGGSSDSLPKLYDMTVNVDIRNACATSQNCLLTLCFYFSVELCSRVNLRAILSAQLMVSNPIEPLIAETDNLARAVLPTPAGKNCRSDWLRAPARSILPCPESCPLYRTPSEDLVSEQLMAPTAFIVWMSPSKLGGSWAMFPVMTMSALTSRDMDTITSPLSDLIACNTTRWMRL